ncbi:N-acetylmuramoyl-L-alanine amidase [Brevibacillus humidisoli]|uniref:N-acetylmuramoyl-L-alanine amidase family protein n=1 Tax=Brevibacillus humidisoli TaxID=2895522 RepID=UPI001E518E4C|nr:N-acetylmuramoyl-L-alanine amidase [Brevibacillus humidisoli]UFJ41262.1 N-acetylmuramoyl-L-alanine amidase [Brevibacillus humidisoli]
MAPLLIIDPGHGGIDPGGGSNQLFTEKKMVLDISLYQYRRFQELGIEVAITRTEDITLDSETRAEIVRSSDADYCISNHINTGGGRGAEAIYSIYATAALPSTLLDQLEAVGMPRRRVFTRAYPGNPRLDYYYMHRETGKVETVILEYGFADNPLDAQKIDTDWEALSEAVVRGFCEHTGKTYRPPSGSDTPAPNPPNGTPVNWDSLPDWKREGVDWLYEQGLLTSADWRSQIDQPLPLWAEAVVLRRFYEKLRGNS